MCGYFARSREKFLRALEAEQFVYALGWRPLSAHFCIALASRCSRIFGRAFIFSVSSVDWLGTALRTKAQRSGTQSCFFQ